MTLTREKRSKNVPAIIGTIKRGRLYVTIYKAKAKVEFVKSKTKTPNANPAKALPSMETMVPNVSIVKFFVQSFIAYSFS